MGILDFFTGEFIEVIEWTTDDRETLVYRFPVKDNAIKMGAQLTVREGQAAVFINEGRLADVYTPGRYELTTSNMPIMTKLNSWKHGFETPFKAEVYFVSTRQFTDGKWGTPNPVMMRDPELGPVRVRAFGTYAFRVADPAKFMQEIVGTDGRFEVSEIDGQLRSHVVSSFSTAVASSGVPVLDLATKYREIGDSIRDAMQGDFDGYGLGLVRFIIENVSLPPEVEKALDKRSSIGMVGDLGRYTQFQAANAMEAAASAPGGGAGQGIGLGVGMAMGQTMAAAMGGGTAAPAQAAAPAAGGNDLASRLQKLKGLLDAGLISQADFDSKKNEILAEI